MFRRSQIGRHWKTWAGGSLDWSMRERQQAIVLMYHEVLPDSVDIPSWLVVKQSAFQRQMKWLMASFDVVSLDQALVRLQRSEETAPVGRPMAVVTFDDGYSGNLSCVLPFMRAQALPFTVFVSSRIVSDPRRFWYDDIACALLQGGGVRTAVQTSRGPISVGGCYGMAAHRWDCVQKVLDAIKRLPEREREQLAVRIGNPRVCAELRMLSAKEIELIAREPLVTIGNHTHGHELLDQLEIGEAKATILKAQEVLREIAGAEPRHFSYPNGNASSETESLIQELEFSTAVGTSFGAWRGPAGRFRIPRVSVGRFDSLHRFRYRVVRAATSCWSKERSRTYA